MATFGVQDRVRGTFLCVLLVSVWLAGCASEKASSSATCGIPTSTNDECPVLTCAVQDECSSIEAATDCCIETFGYGLEGRDLDNLTEDCDGEDCDPASYISEQAAICIAQAHGLEAGVGWCGGAFVNSNPDFSWFVINTVEETECSEDGYGHTIGYEIAFNAKTGESMNYGVALVHGTIMCSD